MKTTQRTNSSAIFAGQRVVVLGAGGHAKVVCDALRLMGCVVIGFLDDNTALQGAQVSGLPVLGPNEMVVNLNVDAAIVAIGDNSTRRLWYERLTHWGIPLISAIHPASVIASDVVLGQSVVVLASAVINASAQVGDNVIVNTGAIIEHDCAVQDHVHLGPGVRLCGGARVGKGAFLGAGTIVIPYRSVGADSVIGAGGVVITDLPARVLAVGVPARVIRAI